MIREKHQIYVNFVSLYVEETEQRFSEFHSIHSPSSLIHVIFPIQIN